VLAGKLPARAGAFRGRPGEVRDGAVGAGAAALDLPPSLTTAQILDLAPDAASRKAGQDQAKPPKWGGLGRSLHETMSRASLAAGRKVAVDKL
jgi:hypothetical protein